MPGGRRCWPALLRAFATRMAARLQDEGQQSSLEPADQPSGGAGGPATHAGADPDDVVDPVQMAREPCAQSSDGAGSDSEKAECRPADLTLGRRGPETRSDEDAALHPQRKRHKQSEHEASSAQASLGSSPPPRELIARGGGEETSSGGDFSNDPQAAGEFKPPSRQLF